MKSVEALVAAWVAGIELSVDGGDLVLRAPHPPPEAVLAMVSKNKLNIFALLRTTGCALADLQAAYEERAAILEFDGGMKRDAAEREARSSLEDLATYCAECGIIIP